MGGTAGTRWRRQYQHVGFVPLGEAVSAGGVLVEVVLVGQELSALCSLTYKQASWVVYHPQMLDVCVVLVNAHRAV